MSITPEEQVRELYEAKEDGDWEASPWEDQFVDDLFEKVDALGPEEVYHPTAAQQEKLEEIYDAAFS